jgi:S-adenosylmethionine decarboxylase proenzyme
MMKNAKIINPAPDGNHALIELYDCNKSEIDNLNYLQTTIEQIVSAENIGILDQKFEKFTPYGVTGIFLLSASHISIHTWPEIGYCTIDVFTCSGKDVTNNIYNGIIDAIKHNSSKINVFKRGYEYKMPKYSRELLIFSTGEMMTMTVGREILMLINRYQKIEIVETVEFGKCLLINDTVQLSEYDHALYDDALTCKITEKNTNVLILGGGDGFVAKTIIEKYPNIKTVDVVDIDRDVVRVCNEFFHKNSLDKKIKFIFEDANRYLENIDTIQYDYIVCDLTDDPVNIDKKDFVLFYTKMLKQLTEKTKSGTIVAMQAGTPKVCNGVDSYAILTKLAKEYGKNVTTKFVDIPSFGEEAAFVFFKT